MSQRKLTCLFAVLVLLTGACCVLAQEPGPVAPWSSGDVGSPVAGNSVTNDGETFMITGAGSDIWGSSDNFQFMFFPMEGDATMTVRVTDNGTGSNSWAKGGIMVRQSLNADSSNVMVAVTGGSGDGGTFQWRETDGAGSGSSRTLTGIAPPYWVRLIREGNSFTALMSADGETWEQEGEAAHVVEMTDPVYIGLAMTSHQSGELRTFTFDSLTGEGGADIDAAALKPYAPTPSSGTSDLLRDEVVLSWVPGTEAATHNVFLGTNMDEVVDGTALVADGLTDAIFAPGRLAFDATYYWRVESVSSDPEAPVETSQIWNLTIEPEALDLDSIAGAIASSAEVDSEPTKTIDGSGLTDGAHGTDLTTMWLITMDDVDGRWIQYDLGSVQVLSQMKVWNHNSQTEAFLGYGIKEAKVEVSSDGETWTEVGTVEIPQATGSDGYMGSEIALDGATGQYVKLTVLSNYSILGLTQAGLSEVQFSYIPVKARELQPEDETATDDINVTLSWRAGRLAALHEVVASNDMQAVIDNNAVVAVTEDLSFDLEDLDLAGVYFWKINEVNEAETPAVHEGDVLYFTTPLDRVIDDMEMYKAEDGYYIWQSWADGFGHDDNGSVVGNGDNAETGVVYEGSQSLPMTYDNTSSPISEVTLGFDEPLDLTKGSAEALKLRVRGDGLGVILGDDTVTIGAAGADIWGAADEFRYVYKSLAGDGAISARVDNLDVVHNWAKAGVMIRGSLTASSEMAFVATTGANGTRYQYRLEDGVNATSNDGAMDGIQQTLAASPVWVKIERVGDDLNGYYSQVQLDPNTGEEVDPNWVPMGENPVAVVMGEAYVGLAVTSHTNDIATTAVYSNVETTGADGDWMEISFGTAHGNNDPAPMYLRLTDADGKELVIDHPDAAATNLTSWYEWVVTMDDMSSINPAAIAEITVGVGGDDAMGKVYVDYIHTTRAFMGYYDLAAQYPLDGDVLDISGNGFDGTVNGTPTFIDGAIGQALEFDGTSEQYVDLGTFDPSFISGQLSLALWAKWNGLSGQWQGLTGKRDNWDDTNTMWQIEAHQSSGVLSFARNGSNVGSGDKVLPEGEWQHVGVSFDGTNAKFFIDGAVTNEGPFSFGPDTEAAVILGCCQANGGNPFNGALDEFYIYDRGISDDEMAALATLPEPAVE